MVLSGSRGGLWRSARQYPARIPLRIKLISSLLALVIVALLLISFAGLSFLEIAALVARIPEIANPATAEMASGYRSRVKAIIAEIKERLGPDKKAKETVWRDAVAGEKAELAGPRPAPPRPPPRPPAPGAPATSGGILPSGGSMIIEVRLPVLRMELKTAL